MQTQLEVGQQQTIKLNPISPVGRPLLIKETPVWEVKGDSITVLPSEDGLSCVIVGSDVGRAEIEVSLKADFGTEKQADVRNVGYTFRAIVLHPDSVFLHPAMTQVIKASPATVAAMQAASKSAKQQQQQSQ